VNLGLRGRWAEGIPPRMFTWVVPEKLAVSERPGGFGRTHRPVRRQEEIVWIKVQGFTRVVSVLPSPHNLKAYQEMEVTCSQVPMVSSMEAKDFLADLFGKLHNWIENGEKILLHHDELNDKVMGIGAGYLVWSGRVETGSEAVAVIEHGIRRQMGPAGRELVVVSESLGRQHS